MSTVHIVGAGLAGLAAAIKLTRAGRKAVLYDQADHAGGRCRSYHDAVLDRRIDNGNHLLLSANRAALEFLAAVESGDSLASPSRAAFPFVDVATGARWQARFCDGPVLGRLPLPPRGIPGVSPGQFLGAWKLRRAQDETVAQALDPSTPLYQRFWRPLAVAALNTECEAGAAKLLWPVVAETVLRGGRFCRPMVAREGLSQSFIDPAVKWLTARGAELKLGWRLNGFASDGDLVTLLDFARGGNVEVDGPVVIALPPASAMRVVPGLDAPRESRAIVNGHFRTGALGPLPRLPYGSPLIGVLGGTAEWLFLRGDVVSVTVSAADKLAEEDEAVIAKRLWRDIVPALGIGAADALPPYRIVKEKRATFSQTPAELKRRAGTRTRWSNLFLAGDWTDNGLPATIEGAIRSGFAAATAVAG
jgi:squalene-associated FAD-dependent desaturase